MLEQPDQSLLIVDDDATLRTKLGKAMTKRGFQPYLAASVKEACEMIMENPPAFAIVDLRLEDGDGLEVVDAIHDARADARVVMFSGYGNIPSAVAAVKAGAIDYLPKPSDADAIEKALFAPEGAQAEPPEQAMCVDKLRLEHIGRIYHQTNQNTSETARLLGMHRRTLQRILARQKAEIQAYADDTQDEKN